MTVENHIKHTSVFFSPTPAGWERKKRKYVYRVVIDVPFITCQFETVTLDTENEMATFCNQT